MRCEYRRDERAVPATDVDQRADAIEVIGGEDDARDAASALRHRMVEDTLCLRRCEHGEGVVDTVEELGGYVSGAHAVDKSPPSAPRMRTEREHDRATDRIGCVLAKQGTERRERELAVVDGLDDSQGRERSQQSSRRAWLRADDVRDFRGSALLHCERIHDVELGGCVDGLRYPAAADESPNFGQQLSVLVHAPLFSARERRFASVSVQFECQEA